MAAFLLSCAGGTALRPSGSGDTGQAELRKLTPAKILPRTDQQKQVDGAIDQYLQAYATRRSYIMVDKPIYQPGETIWFRAELRQTATLASMPDGYGVTMQLVSPKGAVVMQTRVMLQGGIAENAFDLPDEAQGGEYRLQLLGDEGTVDARPLIVASYEAPRLKKTLEFIRKAYGPGDQVSAAVQVNRATGEAFAKQKLTAVVMVDDAEVARVPLSTDDQGRAVVKFALPGAIEKGDGLLTVMADDGGVVESIQKRIPIVLKNIDFAMFPEGGELVEGIPGRVYFTAKTKIGKPADVEGRVVDETGAEVAKFKSLHDGMGRFELSPEKGHTYKVEIAKPVGLTATYEVPAAKDSGCALQAIDDFAGAKGGSEKVRVVAWCTEDKSVLAEAVLREQRLASAAVDVVAMRPALIELPIEKTEQGALRVTLFNEFNDPLAERLVYHGRMQDLKVAITSDKKTYGPRDPVTLTVKTTDLAGKAVAANLGVSVVDDTVLSFADDKSANLLAHIYLEKELGATPEDPIEEPNFYFGDKPEAAASLDLLMGTRGWRRFEWQMVFTPQPQYGYSTGGPRGGMDEGDMMMAPQPQQVNEAPRPVPAAPPADKAPRAPGRQPAANNAPKRGADRKAVEKVAAAEQKDEPKKERAKNKKDMAERQRRDNRNGGGGAGRAEMEMDEDFNGGEDMDGNGGWGWAPVRVFPGPTYQKGYDGPRTDFRETILWAPRVQTNKDGFAKVTFFMNDAVTSFRVVAEGASAGGLPGRGEQVIQSKMPMSLDVHLPLEVSQGDKILLPVQLTNETDRELTADLATTFGAAFRLVEDPAKNKLKLKAHEKRTLFFPLEVVGQAGGEGDVSIALNTEGLKDEIAKKIRVVPLGFPFEAAAAGTAKGGFVQKHSFDLTGALPGTIVASVSMYPSPLASMTQGAAAMIRQPGGCFEQTSATNYPNIMVMQYLQSNEVADPAVVDRASAYLESGYRILTGYESKEKGYEWFGENPGHEALTAYGLMEFADMAQVFPDVDRSMVERTADWLMSRRDGKGGFERNAKALDSFGRASYETTNAYVMWALSEAKRAKGLEKELAVSRKVGLESKDPYMVALAANTFLNIDPKADDTQQIVKRLVELQSQDGSFANATQSITMSGGESLVIETTALATLALIKASPSNEYEPQLRSGVEWLNGHRGGWGEWGNTQGTILGLKTLTAYTEHSKTMQASGTAAVYVNGKKVGEVAFEKGRKEAIEFAMVGEAMIAGKNTVEIKLDSETSLPYSVAIEYRASKPQSSPNAKVSVTTKLAKNSVKLGEGIKLRAHIENETKDGIPMTLARIGLPGGLTFQTWQLKELKDKGTIGFYETREREVILYFRAMPGSAAMDIDLDLMARVPGTYVAPASSAYLYYTDEDKSWAPALEVTVNK